MEQQMPWTTWQGQIPYQGRCMCDLYSNREPLYLEINDFGVGLGVGLLHERIEMSCLCLEVPDNAALHS